MMQPLHQPQVTVLMSPNGGVGCGLESSDHIALSVLLPTSYHAISSVTADSLSHFTFTSIFASPKPIYVLLLVPFQLTIPVKRQGNNVERPQPYIQSAITWMEVVIP
jgi:hypothetical protein